MEFQPLLLLTLVLLISFLTSCECVVPLLIPAAIAGLVSIFSAPAIYIIYTTNKPCDGNWYNPNITGLYYDLNQKLHGQHLVKNTVVSSIKGHVQNHNPRKALVLSFHGWTGSGKNFVSEMVADNLFEGGMSSRNVHLLISTHHFLHKSKLDFYKDQLRSWIHGNVSLCRNTMFIFDEIDKMMPELLDVIVPFIDYHHSIDNIDFRHTIFIFLSNLGGTDIATTALKNWESGKERESITLKEMEDVISTASFNAQNTGLYYSAVIQQHLISAYIPFLPLERKHVKLCIVDDILSKGYARSFITENLKNDIADQLDYQPWSSQLFSKSGCKRISEKADILIEEMILTRN